MYNHTRLVKNNIHLNAKVLKLLRQVTSSQKKEHIFDKKQILYRVYTFSQKIFETTDKVLTFKSQYQ